MNQEDQLKLHNIISKIEGLKIAYDGCHKIYICEDQEDVGKAEKTNYKLIDFNTEDLENIFKKSCNLRFIYNWKLTKTFVEQYQFNQEALWSFSD